MFVWVFLLFMQRVPVSVWLRRGGEGGTEFKVVTFTALW